MANETFEELQGREVIVDERQLDWQPEERERLQQMSTNQCERLAVETSQGERNKIAADEHQPA